MITKHIPSTQKITLVSLGCGNGSKDRILCKSLLESGYDCAYIGVDSSMKMIEYAKE